jgi:hypothetical protein
MKLDHKDETQLHVSEEFDNINVTCMWMRFLHMDDDYWHISMKLHPSCQIPCSLGE